MEIMINGKVADITIDREKTVGDVMAGIDQWLSDSGHRLSALSIDGKILDYSRMEEGFSREIASVKTLEISTSSVPELAIQCLLHLLGDLDEFNSLSFDEKNSFYKNWKTRPQAQFASSQLQDVFSFYDNAFSREGISSDFLRSMTEERIREIQDPSGEFKNLRALVDEICARLADVSLDIQTGKDARSSQTIQIFSGVAEKILRVYGQLDFQGYLETPVNALINEFNAAVKELFDAYERQDTVLVGDLAEYEISPRLLELYNCISANIREKADQDKK